MGRAANRARECLWVLAMTPSTESLWDKHRPKSALGWLSVRLSLWSMGFVVIGFVGLAISFVGLAPDESISLGYLAPHPLVLVVLVGFLAVGMLAGLVGGVCAVFAAAADRERSMLLIVPLAQAVAVLYLMRGDLQKFFSL